MTSLSLPGPLSLSHNGASSKLSKVYSLERYEKPLGSDTFKVPSNSHILSFLEETGTQSQ